MGYFIFSKNTGHGFNRALVRGSHSYMASSIKAVRVLRKRYHTWTLFASMYECDTHERMTFSFFASYKFFETGIQESSMWESLLPFLIE